MEAALVGVLFFILIHRRDVRYWHKADIPKPPINVRFRG